MGSPSVSLAGSLDGREGLTDTVSTINLDSWKSVITGIGDAARDRRMSATYEPAPLLNPYVCRILYERDFFSGRAADVFPEEALKEGFKFSCVLNPYVDTILNEDLAKEEQFIDAVEEALSLGMAMGGCLLWPISERDMDPTAPPLWGPPVMGAPIHHWEVVEIDNVGQIENDVWGQPAAYGFSTVETGRYFRVSASRLVRARGVRTSKQTRIENAGWDLSILQKLVERLRDFGLCSDALSLLMQNPGQSIYKMKGLSSLMASGNQDAILKRIAAVEMQRSAARPIAIDSEDDFQVATIGSLTGIRDLFEAQMYLMSAMMQIPVSILFGKSASGLNATGENDFRGFYSRAEKFRKSHVTPLLMGSARLFLLSKGLVLPQDTQVVYPSLWQASDTESATAYATRATADVAYIQAGVLAPEEVRSRFEGENNTGIQLQKDLDAAEIAKGLTQVSEPAPQPQEPEEPAEPQATEPDLEGGDAP